MKKLQKFSPSGTGYIYTNTRVRVMKSKLLSKEDFEKLIKMSLPEIARFLQEREYKKEFDELGKTLSGAVLVEYALNRNIENQFSSILRFSVRSAREELEIYLKRFDIMNLKTVLRGKLSGIKNEIIMNELVASGKFDKEFFKETLEKCKSFEDVIEYFSATEYYPIIKKNQNDMPKLEDELDRFYYEHLLRVISRPLADFISYEIALKNLAIHARIKKHNLTFKSIKGGKKIRTPEILQDSIELRTTLKKNLIKEALKMASKFTRDVTPVVGYFMAKENEAGNIRLVVRGKQSDLGESAIKQQIILGE